MLKTLSIKNYALIENIFINFNDNLSMITGETGAGKSILLGGLGLVLGKRADLASLKNKNIKCVVEAQFEIKNYHLKSLFNQHDLDYDGLTILRRELLPSGKSRAFINDTPTNLSTLTEIGNHLIDIHSQNQSLQISNQNFQLKLLDDLADTKAILIDYKGELIKYTNLKKELGSFKDTQQKEQQQYDYNKFLCEELTKAMLKKDEQLELEDKLEILNNIELIKEILTENLQIVLGDELGILNLVNKLKTNLSRLSKYGKNYENLSSRMGSLHIELDDITNEIEKINESLDYNPTELEQLNNRVQTIYNLQKKHHVSSIIDLIDIRNQLQTKIEKVENSDEEIIELENKISQSEKKLNILAQELNKKRANVIPGLLAQLKNILTDLGMANSRFQLNLKLADSYLSNGKNKVELSYSADKGIHFGELKKIASGGEMSRIMLALKLILSKYAKLPTLVFDEIDAGVSGEISNKMAAIMQQMSKVMQIITITHLPQIAAKGIQHFKVFKKEDNNNITTQIKELKQEERIIELAEMLGGQQITSSAIAHAKQLLN